MSLQEFIFFQYDSKSLSSVFWDRILTPIRYNTSVSKPFCFKLEHSFQSLASKNICIYPNKTDSILNAEFVWFMCSHILDRSTVLERVFKKKQVCVFEKKMHLDNKLCFNQSDNLSQSISGMYIININLFSSIYSIHHNINLMFTIF